MNALTIDRIMKTVQQNTGNEAWVIKEWRIWILGTFVAPSVQGVLKQPLMLPDREN